jgi:hypothetical protein
VRRFSTGEVLVAILPEDIPNDERMRAPVVRSLCAQLRIPVERFGLEGVEKN